MRKHIAAPTRWRVIASHPDHCLFVGRPNDNPAAVMDSAFHYSELGYSVQVCSGHFTLLKLAPLVPAKTLEATA